MNDVLFTVVVLVTLPLGYGLLKPVFAAWARRVEGRAPATALPDPRMERMEQAIEAIAVEIERISEAQRFTTKLLSERVEDRDGQSRALTGGRSR